MQTIHPHTQAINKSILDDVISYCRNYASTYAEDRANEIFPIIMPWTEWQKHWDFAWNSAFAYASEGLTTSQLFKGDESE